VNDAEELMHRLQEPFEPSEVDARPGRVAGGRALVLHYIDARCVMDRLDDVVGADNWQDVYESLPTGCVTCKLSIRIGGEWVTKMDVGAPSDQPDPCDRQKAAFSDALKRAAVKWGVGRYLYSLGVQWHDYSPEKKFFTSKPPLPAKAQPISPAPKETVDLGRELKTYLLAVAEQGTEALRAAWEKMPKAERELVLPHWQMIKQLAAKHDGGVHATAGTKSAN